jgi:Profilin
MSWADYANYLLAEGCCEEGGIIGTNGAIWAASPSFRLEAYKASIDNEGKEESVDVDETKGLLEGKALSPELGPKHFLSGFFPCFYLSLTRALRRDARPLRRKAEEALGVA